MLSLRESDGMVYAEALLAGTPCLYSSGRNIDGILPDGETTLGINSKDTITILSDRTAPCAIAQQCQKA